MDLASRTAFYQGAILAFDDNALEEAITRCASLAERDQLHGAVAKAWLALMRGRASELASMAELFARASASRDPSQVIEVTALRAMVALASGQLAESLAFARRASLMARTEALPALELLANVVLSRLRRHSGKSYLAVRILSSLARVQPAVASGWLDWERFLAGGTDLGVTIASALTPAARAVARGQELLLGAREGKREAFEEAATELGQASAGFMDMQREARALVSLLDPYRQADEPVFHFKRGDSDELPYGLVGARVLSGEEEPCIGILAVARPNERGHRILRDGLGLFGACRMLSEDGPRRTHGRTDTGLAVLTLSGPDTSSEEEFFMRVYGFAYSHGKHRGVLDVLLHRMRQRIGSSAALVRSGGGFRLDLREPIAVADPRCSPPAAARILSALARQPLATADVIAGRLGITLRAAQMALQQLVSDGSCAMQRTGRQIHYQLQDSTFSEPTGNDALGLDTSTSASAKEA
jgi:hypothetical protein